ncbi:MAG: helix-turn-helix transcriptional regulator [Eubacterium sp.]|nr:helix-turn-helix transcriptional regulator [Eubacterium sp.]
MDNYKFGNLICSLRESHNLTQKELADILDVSDKAVSKWENGQAIPRMDTLEKMAQTLETTVEELIIASKDNIKRILIVNSFGTLLHFQVDNEIISLKTGEEKWMFIDPKKDEYNVTLYGELSLEELVDANDEPKNLKEKLVNKGLKKLSKWADKQINRQIIRTKCFYTLTGIQNEEKIEVENEIFSAGDKMWIFKDLDFSYPKINCNCNVKLTNAVCINKTDVYADFKKQALTSELGISIPLMLLAFPFRKMYFKSVLKPKGLMKYISKADYYVKKNNKELEKSKKTKHPIIKTIGVIILFIILWFGIDIGFGIINVETDKPYLVSADFSTITYGREEYVRIEDLPKDVISSKLFGAEVWTDARIDGYSKADQYFDGHKVCEYTDKENNTYLWLVTDYIDTIIDEETGEHKDYDDFSEHYVYVLKE